MRRKTSIISLLLLIALFTVSCGEKAVEEPAPAATEEASVEEVKEEPAPAPEPEPEPEPEREEVKEEKAYYTDKFTKVDDYAKYGESGDAKSGDMIWVEGYIDEYDESGNRLLLTSDDGPWSVSVGADGTDDFYDLVKETVGMKVRVFGKYTGYSKDLSMPAVAFLPKEYQPFAYRLESVDNNFRLTQLDYHYEKPDFDSENTLGKLSFKESSAWESKDEDGTLLYYFNDDIPTLIMAHREAIADAGFDEIDKDQLLADVAEDYVGETGEILRQTPFKLSGYPALCFENTWTDEDLPVAMSLFCYMFIIDDEYYYFGCGEPFLVGESCKRLLPDMLKDFKVGEEASTKSKDSKADDKSADASKTDTSKADASKTDATKTEEAKDTTAKEETTKTEEAAPAQEPPKKTGHPTKDELLGKVFSQTMTATLTGIEDPSQVYSGSETLPDFLFTADMVAAYNESNGTYSYTETQNGETMTMSMTFSYNADGKIAYSGPVSITAAQFTGTGTVTGVEK